jgi:hypothetical protein
MAKLQLKDLPFLRSLCWQGHEPSIDQWSELDVLNLYERNWRLRGVMADVTEVEAIVIRELAMKYHSWLVNEIESSIEQRASES